MSFVSSGPATVLTASLLFAVFIAAFHGAGSRVVGGALSRESVSDILLYHAFTISIGALLLSVWIFAWGAVWLSPAVVLAFAGLGLMACWLDKRRHGAAEARALAVFLKGTGPVARLYFAVFAALLALTFFAAQAPETGNDSMAYHLYFPKLHALAGRFVHDPLHPRSLWPAMMGMLFTAGLLLQGTALAKLFAWMTLVLGFAAAAAFARTCFGAPAARWTLFFMAATPVLWQQSLYAYTDNAILLFALLSFVALWRWEESGFLPRNGVVAGLCLGALLSIKFSTLAPAVFLVGIFGVRMGRKSLPDLRAKIPAAVLVLAVAAAVCGFWYVRSWMLTGNPVFPFMAGVFGNGFSQRMVGYALIPKTPLNFFLLPWNLTMKVATFGGEPLGVLLLAALPLLVFFPRRNSAAVAMTVFFTLYAAAWYAAIQHIRFFLPAIPFLCLILGVSAAQWVKGRSGISRVLMIVFAAAALLQCALTAYFTVNPLKGAFGFPSAGQYLQKNERSFAFMEAVTGALAPGDGVLIEGEPRLFYAPAGAIYMSPIITRECQTHNITLREWLDEHAIYHIVTTGDDAVERPEVPATLVFSKMAHEGSRPIHYALWRRNA